MAEPPAHAHAVARTEWRTLLWPQETAILADFAEKGTDSWLGKHLV